jgi:hypothetical protein
LEDDVEEYHLVEHRGQLLLTLPGRLVTAPSQYPDFVLQNRRQRQTAFPEAVSVDTNEPACTILVDGKPGSELVSSM